jgi:hypothetical protein
MHTTLLASMTLDCGGCVDDLQLIRVGSDCELVARHDRDLRKNCPLRLPTFGAPAHVVVSGLRADFYFYGVLVTLAHQSAAREVFGSGLHTLIHGWMD